MGKNSSIANFCFQCCKKPLFEHFLGTLLLISAIKYENCVGQISTKCGRKCQQCAFSSNIWPKSNFVGTIFLEASCLPADLLHKKGATKGHAEPTQHTVGRTAAA